MIKITIEVYNSELEDNPHISYIQISGLFLGVRGREWNLDFHLFIVIPTNNQYLLNV